MNSIPLNIRLIRSKWWNKQFWRIWWSKDRTSHVRALFIGVIIAHCSIGDLLKPVCSLPYNLMTSTPATLQCAFQVDKISLTTNWFHSYYGGSEIIVAGKVSSSNKDQVYEDLGAHVNAWSGTEHKEVSYKPFCISKSSLVRLSYINKMIEWWWMCGYMSESLDRWVDKWMDGCKGG